jgi:GNAT superfamily N-acetyltransferase
VTIDVERDLRMPEGRHACDALGTHMEDYYRRRPDIRYDVTLSLKLSRPRSASVVYLRTLHKRRGHGSTVMDELVRAADLYDVTLDLDARAVREDGPRVPGLGQADLVAFYRRRGFRTVSEHDGSATMRRLAPSLRRRS